MRRIPSIQFSKRGIEARVRQNTVFGNVKEEAPDWIVHMRQRLSISQEEIDVLSGGSLKIN